MKLLQKTIRHYLLYSVFILLVAIPAFYLVIQHILRLEVDEELTAKVQSLKPRIANAVNDHTLGSTGFVNENMKITVSNSPDPYDSLSTIELYDTTEKEIIPYRVLRSNFLVNGHAYLLYIKTSLMENDDLIKSIVAVQAILLILLLGGLFLINRNLSKRIWEPFYHTLDKLRNYNVEKHAGLGLAKSSVNEFTDLNKSLDELADKSHKAYISQKEFTENASHEMQTPLAIFQSKLELLMQTSPLNEEQADLMDQLSDASQRMRRLNKSLILLTKIENNQFSDIESVSLSEVVSHFLKQYDLQIIQKQITVIELISTDIILQANRILVDILVSNLLGNAIRHNNQSGVIKLFIEQDLFIIRNTGKADALSGQRLFRRFQKESTDSNSIGLGLEIVKKIGELYGYGISYQHDEHLHGFRIDFKKRQIP